MLSFKTLSEQPIVLFWNLDFGLGALPNPKSKFQNPKSFPSGALSRELLATTKEIFENAKSNNSMPEKEFGFLLTTKDITPFINAKIAPELAPKPTPNHRNTIKNEE